MIIRVWLLPILTTCFRSSPSLIARIKFCAMYRIQYTWVVGVSCQPFWGSLYALLIDSCLSEIKQISLCGVPCLLKFFRISTHTKLHKTKSSQTKHPKASTQTKPRKPSMQTEHPKNISTFGLHNKPTT